MNKKKDFLIVLIIFILFGLLGTDNSLKVRASNNNFSLTLNEGWNLISLPRWADKVTFQDEANIKAVLAFREGQWVDNSVIEEELNNPASALFIKVNGPTVVRFQWSDITPQMQFASVSLTEGWNLISTSIRTDYATILAGLIDEGSGGLSVIYAPNNYNARKQAGYHLPWPDATISLTESRQLYEIDMYPLDGYWVFMRGRGSFFTTPVVDNEVVAIGN